MAKLQPLIINDFRPGIQTNLSAGLSSPSTLRYSVNMFNDSINSRVGALTSRPGTKYIGNLISEINALSPGDLNTDSQVSGIFPYENNILVAVTKASSSLSGTYVWDGNANTWKLTSAITHLWNNGTPVRFESYVGYIFGADNGAFLSWSRTNPSNWGTTKLTSAPSTINLLKEYKGRLYASSTSSNIVYFAIADVSLNVTWDTTYQRFPVGTDSFNTNTALEKNGESLLICKANGIYLYDGTNLSTSPITTKGVISQELIKTIGNTSIYLSQLNNSITVQRFEGGQSIDISGPIREYLNYLGDYVYGATKTIRANFGLFEDGNNFYLSIWDCKVDGEVRRNVILCYNPIQNSWTDLSFLNSGPGSETLNFFKYGVSWQFTSAPDSDIYNNLDSDTYVQTELVIAGTSMGNTSASGPALLQFGFDYDTLAAPKLDTYASAVTAPISILCQTQVIDHGSKLRKKTINKFAVIASGNYGFVSVQLRIDGGKWKTLKSLTDKKTIISVGKQAYYYDIRLVGLNSGDPFVLEAIEIFDVDIEDYAV